ncbi:hypothetical protein [Chryseobacterium sp. 18068]|nr:hypothetical protein [Chryseobacterium sp. 18068]
MQRKAITEGIISSYFFLATDATAQITGQVIHPNGGLIING